MRGFVKVERTLFESKMWTQKRTYSDFEAYLDILQMVCYEPCEILGVKLVSGQAVISYRNLASRWSRSIGYVQKFLSRLEKQGILFVEKTGDNTIISMQSEYTSEYASNTPTNTLVNTPNYTDNQSSYEEVEYTTEYTTEYASNTPANTHIEEYKEKEYIERDNNTCVRMYTSSGIKPIDSLMDVFDKSPVWREDVRRAIWQAKRFNVTEEMLRNFFSIFLTTIKADGEDYKEEDEAKRHFNRWLLNNITKLINERNENRTGNQGISNRESAKQQRDEDVATFIYNKLSGC